MIRRVSQIGTLLKTLFYGVCVGVDERGHRYFFSRQKDWAGRETRWVFYKGEPEASKIPPLWRAWLQHLRDQPLPSGQIGAYFWQKPHVPNLTGSNLALLPSGHTLCQLRNQTIQTQTRDEWVWKSPAQEGKGYHYGTQCD